MIIANVEQNLIELFEELFSDDKVHLLNGDLTDVPDDLVDDFEDAASVAAKELGLSTITSEQLATYASTKLIELVGEASNIDHPPTVLASIRCLEHADTYSESIYVFLAPVSNTIFETHLILESDESSAFGVLEASIRDKNENLDEDDITYSMETMQLMGVISPK